MKPRVIVWDWDNTLVDSRPIVVAALHDVAKKYHLPPVTDRDVTDVIGTHMGRYWHENFDDNNREEALRYFLSCYLTHNDKLALFPLTQDVLAWVQSRGIPQYVISNKNQQIVDPECDRFGLRSFFVDVVGTDERHIVKPSQALAAAVFGADYPSPMIMIGDGESDMKFAQTLKAFGLFIRPGNDILPYPYDKRVPDLQAAWDFLKEYIREV